MNYYKFRNRFSRLKGGETYVEAQRGTTLRQIVFLNGEIIASNRPHPDYGFTLPTGYVDYAAFQEINAAEIKAGLVEPLRTIDPEEFEQLWEQHLAAHRTAWEEAKAAYPPGTAVAGPVATYYPQGVLIALGHYLYGLADGRATRASARETLFPGHKVHAVVAGYDERNQWLLLDSPAAE